jgi:hypothetical protein
LIIVVGGSIIFGLGGESHSALHNSFANLSKKRLPESKSKTNFKSIYIWTNLSSHGQLAILTREIGASLAVCLVDGDSTTPRPLQANGRVPPQQSKQTQISVCQIKHGVASTEIHKGGHRPSLPPVPSRDPMAASPTAVSVLIHAGSGGGDPRDRPTPVAMARGERIQTRTHGKATTGSSYQAGGRTGITKAPQ